MTRPRSGRAGPAQTRRAADLSARLEALLRRGVADGGRLGQDTLTFKNRGGRSLRNLNVSVTFS